MTFVDNLMSFVDKVLSEISKYLSLQRKKKTKSVFYTLIK